MHAFLHAKVGRDREFVAVAPLPGSRYPARSLCGGIELIPLALARVHESRRPDSTLDLPGLALVSTGVLGVVGARVRGNAAGWASAEVLATLVGGPGARRRVRGLRAAHRGADAADALLRIAGLSAGDAAIFIGQPASAATARRR
ncbi:MAG: hypothetical protein M3065_17460, partial [Actinomycetota bacterium]|nr:hypothetical protein [Actinomycetota bacterium]